MAQEIERDRALEPNDDEVIVVRFEPGVIRRAERGARNQFERPQEDEYAPGERQAGEEGENEPRRLME